MSSVLQVRPVFVAGIAITRFGYYPKVETYEYASKAVFDALDDAGMEWKSVQAVFCGSAYQGVASGHKVIKEVGMTGIPIVNIENACSSSSSAFRLAYQEVATGIHDVVLALGIEKNPKGPIPSTGFRLWELQLGFNLQPANYAIETKEYMERTGATEEDFSLVTIKNRRNASLNPNARFQTTVTMEEIINSKMISTPLRLLHCCPLADGAAVTILCSQDKLKSMSRAVRVDAAVLTSSPYGDEYIPAGIVGSVKFPPKTNTASFAAQQAYEMARCGPEDIDVVQAYDTVSPCELWEMENLGFGPDGEAPRLLRKGYFDINGKLPTNTDGGLMGRGHPMGATGLAQIIEIVTQLRREAGLRQIAKAKAGLAHSMGGGPNSSVIILSK